MAAQALTTMQAYPADMLDAIEDLLKEVQRWIGCRSRADADGAASSMRSIEGSQKEKIVAELEKHNGKLLGGGQLPLSAYVRAHLPTQISDMAKCAAAKEFLKHWGSPEEQQQAAEDFRQACKPEPLAECMQLQLLVESGELMEAWAELACAELRPEMTAELPRLRAKQQSCLAQLRIRSQLLTRCITSSVPVAAMEGQQVTYVTDVEGHWDYFCNYVDLAEGVKFATAGDHRDARTPEDLELTLAEGWHFVFGGDSCDKGPGSVRFIQAMVKLKRKYPDRVHLIAGNRDLNKTRYTSELADSEMTWERVQACAGAYWVPDKGRVTFLQYLKTLAAAEEKVEEQAVTDEMVKARISKANKLRFMLKSDMGSDGEMEFRRKELAHIRSLRPEDLSDEEVVKSYEDSVKPGGFMYDFLDLCQLGVLLGDALFVHGQIIGSGFPHGQVRGASADHIAWSIRDVPDRDAPVEDVREWVQLLNVWCHRELADWHARPCWETPPTKPTYEGWSARGGADLVGYGCPGTRVPTVVYCRWLEGNSMPLPYPPELVAYLKRQGVRYVVVGHTPHGNSPTVIPNDGVSVIMGDTSFSHMKSNLFYSGDNRGAAVSEVRLGGALCSVRGLTEEGRVLDYAVAPMHHEVDDVDPHVGKVQKSGTGDKRFYVKAKLPKAPGFPCEQYLLNSIEGYKYEYAELDEAEIEQVLSGGACMRTISLKKRCLSGPIGHSFLADDDDQVLLSVFNALDRDKDGTVTKAEIMISMADKLTRDQLRQTFPDMNVQEIIRRMDSDRNGKIEFEEFYDAVKKANVEMRGGLLFELSDVADPSLTETLAFPRRMGSVQVKDPEVIQLSDLRVRATAQDAKSGQERPCELLLHADGLIQRSPEMKELAAQLSETVMSGQEPLRSYLSAVVPMDAISDGIRQALGFPADITHVAFCYPFSHDWYALQSIDVSGASADLAFLAFGSFIGFSKDLCAPVCIKAVQPCAAGGLHFKAPRQLQLPTLRRILDRSESHPITTREYLAAGATDVCWLAPCEEAPAGGLAFLGTFDGELLLSSEQQPEI
eukprot:TRINITY_DN30729_c0_g1_i1.p1 TRINITY_DN30729_c0_g1~~TRINITY_DN30729_c0_g1_i1.p1  ORF type:complete len:1096 (-),score=240.75 TRINITY_DN30729_c0_g1_i1:37-3204(-)